MGKSVGKWVQGRSRALAFSLFAFALPLTGCMVNNSSARCSVIVQWATGPGTTCATIASVNVVATRNGADYGTFTNGRCTDGAMTIQVGEGAYTLHVEAIGGDGSVVAASPAETITVQAYNTVQSDILVLAPTSTVTGSSIQASWTVSGQAAATACGTNGLKTVVLSVYDATQTNVIGSTSVTCATGGAVVANLDPGTYYVLLDGYTPSDVTGHPSWGTPAFKGPYTLPANNDTTVGPFDISPLGASAGVGGLTFSWTVFGASPAAGCAKYSLGKLNVTVLGSDQTTALATTQLDCKTGQASFSNVAAGPVYVRIDEANPPDANAYGNVNLTGPVTILANQTANISAAIDIAQRTIIAIPVAFSDGASCGSHGVSSVQYQISGNGTVLVPFSDVDATKPCDLTNATFKQQVIDLDNSPPACAVPGNVAGIVVCNAHGITTLTVQAHGIQSGAVGFAAKMDVTPLTDGTLTEVQQALLLQACGAGDPLCQ